jgi:hypothetical protein
MSKPLPISVFDRKSNRLFDEFMEDSTSTYESRPRRSAIQWITSSPTVDWLVAAYQNTRFSARKIEPFVRRHHIDVSELAVSNIYGRKAGGGGAPFTAAIMICLLILADMFLWRMQAGPDGDLQPAITRKP